MSNTSSCFCEEGSPFTCLLSLTASCTVFFLAISLSSAALITKVNSSEASFLLTADNFFGDSSSASPSSFSISLSSSDVRMSEKLSTSSLTSVVDVFLASESSDMAIPADSGLTGTRELSEMGVATCCEGVELLALVGVC